LIEDNRWILITGRTGLGKTREAVQLAQSLNNEGWTILLLTRETWLDAPARLPDDIPDRKLVLFLDDLNKKCYSSKAEIRPDASESLTLPIYEPFQTRLYRTLEAFDTFCGKSEIKVIATSRNEKISEFDEPSEWDKLGWDQYNELWKKFNLFYLPEPDTTAEQKFLTETAEKAGILIRPDELSIIAKQNDGTFRNLVENLSSAKSEGVALTLENFRDTLKGTWQKRYQKSIQKYPEAKNIYDSIELLREIGIQLRFSTVVQTARIISGEKFLKHIKSKRKYSSVLKKLVTTESILHPRDGQIEVKGYRVNVQEFFPKLYGVIYSDALRHLSWFKRIDYTIGRAVFPNRLLPKIMKQKNLISLKYYYW
jgi:DNA polymerase III delta prime subunit